MSESKIRRKNKVFNVTLDESTALAGTIHLSDMAGGIVSLGTHDTNATELRVWVAPDVDGPYRALKDKDAGAVKLTLVGTTAVAYTLPDEVFAAPFVKLQLDNTAADGLTATVMAKG